MVAVAAEQQRRPTLRDYVALWILRLAKARRRRLDVRRDGDAACFYEEYFERKDIEAYARDARMVVRRESLLGWLQDHVVPNARVLDVACGVGDVLAAMPARYRLCGVDYARRNALIARENAGGRARVVQASIYELPFGSQSMDVCICLEVLEHLEDDVRAVREIHRVLRPNGFLVASAPYGYYWRDYLRLIGHFRHYTRESFTGLLAENGFVIEAYLPNYPRWHRAYMARYVLVRAEFAVFGRMLGCDSLYAFRWPWQRRFALDAVARRLEPLRRRDRELDYSGEASSTFIAARKTR